MSADAAKTFAAHVHRTRTDDIPATAFAAARTFFLDTLGVGIAGAKAPNADIVLNAVQDWGQGAEASVLARPRRKIALPAPSAALVNAFQIHCQEYDCVHEPAVVHPLATIQAALMAEAERRAARGDPVSGRDFLAALIVSVDVAVTLGIASKSPIRFFRPANAGCFGAVSGLARLAGLDEATTLDAYGLALAQLSGTMQAHVEGKPALPLQIGFAARAAICAVDLARAGMAAPHDVFEGPFGYFPLFEPEYDLAPLLADLARRWRITEVSHKPFPTGRAAQGGIDALQRLQRQHGFEAAQVHAVKVIAPPLIHRLVGRPYQEGMAVNYARLCMGYVGALTLIQGTVGPADFSPDRLSDPALAALARRIEVIVDDNPDPSALSPQRVELTLEDGRTLGLDVPHTLGSPDRPLSHMAHLEKFRLCWRYGLGPDRMAACEALIERAGRFEDAPDAAALIAATQFDEEPT